MTEPAFDSVLEETRLGLLMKKLKELATNLRATRLEESDADAFLISVAWLRLVVSYAEGIESLLHANCMDATAPLLRSMFELDVEVRYLLADKPQERAVRIIVHAALDRVKVLKKLLGPEAAEPFEKLVEHHRALHPSIVKDVESAKDTRHWSGTSRANIIDAVDPVDGRTTYKAMSWASHPEGVEALRALAAGDVQGAWTISQSTDLDPGFIAYQTGGMTLSLWNYVAGRFGFQQIDALELSEA